jgi:hypothetical protein
VVLSDDQAVALLEATLALAISAISRAVPTRRVHA